MPEGLYEFESLHPNSRYHVALRVNYPNAFDRRQGAADGRANLGSDIMVHGGSASIGCLAMGDDVAEELFTLAADVGLDHVSLIITPVDFRTRMLPDDVQAALPEWTGELYMDVRNALERLRHEVQPSDAFR